MRYLFAITNIFLFINLFGQTTTIIYCFPGQGSDKRIFDSLEIDPNYEIRVIEYGAPDKHMTMNSFARQLSAQIDTTKDFVLMGVSLGGMICVELAEMLNPKRTIIISSAKNRNELPGSYKFQRAIPLYKIFPGCILVGGAKILQPLVEPDRNKNKETFKSMLGSKKGVYMKRTVGLLINWERENNTKPICHIHGTNDHTLPFRKIKLPTYTIDQGSHMMTLTRAKEISSILNSVLAR